MKSRTSSYKVTWLKKNITRFLPFWGLYILALLLGLVMLFSRDRFYFIMNLSSNARMMAWVNCGYGLLTAQLLFGDLYSSRMCFGVHSLPLRREELFGINVLSGILFSLIPTAVMALFALPLAMGTMPGAAGIPFLWLAAVNLQYVFFFGLAVLCMMCAGNRLSMAVIYGILNFGSMLVYLLTDSLYVPLLLGVSAPYDLFYRFFPLAKLAGDPLMIVERSHPKETGFYTVQPDSWIYLLICAVLGLVLLLLALQMYRRRSLETAGEFVAVKGLKPVFLVLFSLAAGICLAMAVQMFFNESRIIFSMLFAFVGLLAGWFVGLMLLEKTTRVFTKKTFAGAGLLTAVMAGSLLLTDMDVLGVEAWIPEPSQVEKVLVIPSYDSFYSYWLERDQIALHSPEDLETVQRVHTLALEEKIMEAQYYDPSVTVGKAAAEEPGKRYTVPVSLEYHMKNGSVRRRSYYVDADGEAGQLLEPVFSREAVVFENPESLEYRFPMEWMNARGVVLAEEYLTEADTRALLEVIRQDCLEGTLAQAQEYHRTPIWSDGENRIPCLDLSVGLGPEDGSSWNYRSVYLNVYSDSRHTMKWLRDRGMIQAVIAREDAMG